MTTKRVAEVTFLTMVCLALPTFPQQSKVVTKGPIVIKEFKHDTGPLLREVAPLLPEFGTPSEHEIENNVNPNNPWSNKVQKDPVLQTAENSPSLQTPNFNVEFDGIGYGDNFFCNCMPPDNDGAPGTTQYVQYVNLTYEVFDKSGNTLLGPLSGNDFWSGFGGSCETGNSGDPIVRFDAAAQRWVVAQLGLASSGPDFECVAVSTTADATGSYYRYAFPFNDFPDYPKLGVWPDAYYFTFNNWAFGASFVGANACAADRNNMLAGNAATMQCFQQNSDQSSLLPSDLDGATPPAAGTPNFFVELDPDGSANLDMFQFHVDFTTPANSTFTGPTLIPVAAFTPLCNNFGGHRNCVPQPTAGSDLLEALSDRLMYRLSYRNFGDHTTLLVSHSIVAGSSGGVRWYEIHDPETSPTVFQSGTFAPDSQWRWMPSVAMDQNQDIAVGFSRSGSGSGQYPSIVYAGRAPSDPLGTLESEVVLVAGEGSQISGDVERWGDYTSMTVDPTDDCTFWFTEEYLKSTALNMGSYWSTAIGSFIFPGCSGTPNFSLSAPPNSVTVTQGSSGTSTITIAPVNGFSGNVTLSASGLPSGVTAAFNPNPTTSTSTLTLTASATAATGTVTVTVTGTSGTLTNTTTLSLTVNAPVQSFSLSASPNSVNVTQGSSGASTITITPVNGFSGNVTLSASGLPSGVTAAFNPNPTTSTSTLTLTASATAATGTVTVTITGVSGSLTQTTALSLTVNGTPNFTLSPSPNSVTITQGSSGTSTVTITPLNGFSGNVTLSASGLPSGVTASFNPNPATTTSTLTLTASATAATGTVTVTVTGTSGTLTNTTTLSLTVNAPVQSFSLSASPNAVTIVKGAGSGTSTITITPNNGFSGNVTLTTSKLPTGVTASFSPNPATSSSILTLTAGSTTPHGTTTLTISGTSGTLSATTTITLTVNPLGNFTLTALPKTLTVVQGSSGTSTITINPTNTFDQSVALSASGVPTGVTASFSPDPATSTSTLTLAVSDSAAIGGTTITITGTSGSLSHTTTVRLNTVIPNFTLTALPKTLTVVQGSSGTSTITINPTNTFDQSVALSASGVPTGVTASFSPDPATSTSTLTLAVSGSAKIKTTAITISGTSGSLSHTTTVELTVFAP